MLDYRVYMFVNCSHHRVHRKGIEQHFGDCQVLVMPKDHIPTSHHAQLAQWLQTHFFIINYKHLLWWTMVYLHLLLQPPWDTELGDKYIIHYTYGCDYDMKVTKGSSDLTSVQHDHLWSKFTYALSLFCQSLLVHGWHSFMLSLL